MSVFKSYLHLCRANTRSEAGRPSLWPDSLPAPLAKPVLLGASQLKERNMSSNDDDMPDATGLSASASNASRVLPTEHSKLNEDLKQLNADLLYLSSSFERSNALSGRAEKFEDVFARVVQNAVDRKLPGLVDRKFEQICRLKRSGKTAGEIWRSNKFLPLRNGAQWLGNRLSRAGCQIGDERAELGNQTARLFDPDKAARWLAAGGRTLVSLYVLERQGQGRFNFPR